MTDKKKIEEHAPLCNDCGEPYYFGHSCKKAAQSSSQLAGMFIADPEGMKKHLEANPAPSLTQSAGVSDDALAHTRSCPQLTPASDDECTCGLRWRIELQTEREMHNAWRKRAEEAEAALTAERQAHAIAMEELDADHKKAYDAWHKWAERAKEAEAKLAAAESTIAIERQSAVNFQDGIVDFIERANLTEKPVGNIAVALTNRIKRELEAAESTRGAAIAEARIAEVKRTPCDVEYKLRRLAELEGKMSDTATMSIQDFAKMIDQRGARLEEVESFRRLVIDRMAIVVINQRNTGHDMHQMIIAYEAVKRFADDRIAELKSGA